MGSTYERDFFAWTTETAAKIRERRFQDIELAALAEEIEDLGKTTRRALENRMAVLIAHLLKWTYQPAGRSVSWQATIEEQQRKLRKLLKENPSLRPWIENELADVYESARLIAVQETGLVKATFPGECPFAIDEALNTSLTLS